MFNNIEPVTTEAPASLQDPRFGIGNADVAFVVQCLITHAVYDHWDRRGNNIRVLNRLLDLYASTAVSDACPAPHPELDGLTPGSNGSVVWKRLGTTFEGERERYEHASMLQPAPFVCLPVERLCEFVRPERWRVVATMVSDGPGLYKQRVRQLIHAESLRSVPPKVSRPEGGRISAGTLKQLSAAALKLVTPLKDHAQQRAHPAASLVEDWLVLPSLDKVQDRTGRRLVTDRSAVPPRKLRQAWHRLDAQVAECIRLADGLSEVEAIRRLSRRALRDAHKTVRNRALVAALVLDGGRVDAIARLRQGDLCRSYVHPGGTTPAVVLTPFKTTEGRHPRSKPFPVEALYVFDAYRVLLETWYGRSLHAEEPLFVATLKDMAPLTVGAIEPLLTGARGKSPRRALLPRAEDNPYYGYSPHLIRSTCRQWIDSVEAAEWCREHRIDPLRRDAMGEALLDHSLADVQHLYKGDNAEGGRERLTYWASCICWQMLTTRRGAQKVPDAAAFLDALLRLQATRAERSAVSEHVRKICADAEAHGREVSPTVLMVKWRETEELDRAIRDTEELVAAMERGDDRYLIAWTDDEESPTVDLALVRANASLTVGARDTALRPIRNWVSPRELAEIIGAGESTIASWIAKGLPNRARVRAWDDNRSPVVVLGGRRRALLVELLNPALFDSEEKRKLLSDRMAQDPPAGWEHVPLHLEA